MNNLTDFDKIAPFLSNPLILIGFVTLMFFGLLKALLKAGIIPPLSKTAGVDIVRILLKYAFIISFFIILLGFGLKYRELDKKTSSSSVLHELKKPLNPATVSIQAEKKSNRTKHAWRYEAEPVSSDISGTYVVKVWSYSMNPIVSTEQAKKNAVHAVVFQGLNGKQGMADKAPLLAPNDLTPEKRKYFDNFFIDGGTYMKFATLSNNEVAAKDCIKIGREYKVGVVVSVNVELLRKDLEAAGIVRSLTSGF